MNVDWDNFRTIWLKKGDQKTVQIIDQRSLPHQFVIEDITTVDQMAVAIRDMHLRGAGLIGAAGGYGMYLAIIEDPDSAVKAAAKLNATRPTARPLFAATERQLAALEGLQSATERRSAALDVAELIANEDADHCRLIGEHGAQLIKELSEKKGGETVNIATHCNAGPLAFVANGTATSPGIQAHRDGIRVHFLVDETRPRNQGASLTAWELDSMGIPHHVIVDGASGHTMQTGQVDIVMVGADRVARNGDFANKIGTYMKFVAAADSHVPAFCNFPSSTVDWSIPTGAAIPIEERNPDEVRYIQGLARDGRPTDVLLTPQGSPAKNWAFDVTPARLVTGLVTERGVCKASEDALRGMFPEKASPSRRVSTR